MTTKSNLDTIGLIISLLLSDSFAASVESLSEACDVPVPKMRKYLSVILKNKMLSGHIISDSDDDDLTDDADELANRILSGYADTEIISIMDMEDYIGDYQLLPVTSAEIGYISKTYPRLIQNQRTNMFEIKDTMDSIPDIIVKRQAEIQDAISQKKKVAFNYKSPKDGLLDVHCSPVEVVSNLSSGTLYIKDTDGKYYHMGRIRSNIKILSEPSDIDSYVPNPYRKYFWGNEYPEHGEPIHVRLRIAVGTSNILEKIKSDTYLRPETGSLYKEGDYYIYEDDILGIQDFRRWLRAYGSSITVLEPQSLADDIVRNAMEALAYYATLGAS